MSGVDSVIASGLRDPELLISARARRRWRRAG
jgi:hypothetical protein